MSHASRRLVSFPLLAAAALLLSACQCGVPGTSCKTVEECADSARPHCDTDLLTCVACLEDVHCAEGFVCSPTGTCEAGCRSETDRCTLGNLCKPGVGCLQCLTDASCGAGRVCVNDQCVPGCSATNPTCPEGLNCDIASGRCVACRMGTDCTNPQLPVCNPSNQTCVQCVVSADCTDPSKPVCNPASNTCVGCTGDAQCQPGSVCTNNTCTPGCNATQPCPTGQQCDVAAGRCVACLTDLHCSGSTPRCDVGSNTCVQCLPSNDNCPVGQYCRNDFVCERGCKTGADCPSGICRPDRSCAACTADTQCAAGNVCSNGQCIPACSATAPCGAGKDCCTGRCVDQKNDAANCGACGVTCGGSQTCCNSACVPLNTTNNCGACGTTCGANQACCNNSCTANNTLTNCGACGVTCGTDQFCDGATCRNVTFPEFCANRNVYAITDGQPLDDAATAVLASTIAQHCSAQTQIAYGPQTNALWVDQTTGALLLGGGSTVVTAGGPFPNKPVKWLERTRQATKVFFDSNGIDTYYFKKRSDASILVTRPDTYCTTASSRDVFLVELVTDPTSGTLVLITYGLCGGGYGTRTGAWFWANQMLPNRQSYTHSWYIYEWADGNANATPDTADTFTQLASGI